MLTDQSKNLAQNLETTKNLPTFPSPTIIEIDIDSCDLQEEIFRALCFDENPAPLTFSVIRQHLLFVSNGTSQRSRLRANKPGPHEFGVAISGIDVKTDNGDGILLKGKLTTDLTTITDVIIQTGAGLEPLHVTFKAGDIIRLYLDLSRGRGIIYSVIHENEQHEPQLFQFSVLDEYRFNGDDNVLPLLPFENDSNREMDLHDAPYLNIIWKREEAAAQPGGDPAAVQSGSNIPDPAATATVPPAGQPGQIVPPQQAVG